MIGQLHEKACDLLKLRIGQEAFDGLHWTEVPKLVSKWDCSIDEVCAFTRVDHQ